MKLLLILSHPPFDGSDVIWNALRLGESSLKLGQHVKIFVMNDAVDITRAVLKPQKAEFDLGSMIDQLVNKGAEVKICTTCIKRCGLSKEPPRHPEQLSGMKDLATWIAECDKAVTF